MMMTREVRMDWLGSFLDVVSESGKEKEAWKEKKAKIIEMLLSLRVTMLA